MSMIKWAPCTWGWQTRMAAAAQYGAQAERSTYPVTSSCATAVRAIMTAVGFCICISRSSTLPSLVSLISATEHNSRCGMISQSCVHLLHGLQATLDTKISIQLTTSATNKHLDGAFGAKVGLHDLVQAFGGIYIHEEGCTLAHGFCIWIQGLHGPHGCCCDSGWLSSGALPLWIRSRGCSTAASESLFLAVAARCMIKVVVC